MKLLSFDQSTVASGWAYFIDGKLIGHGVIKVGKECGNEPKWLMMIAKITDVIDEIHPEAVVLEDTIMQMSTKTLKELTRLQGAIVALCYQRNIPYSYLYPTQWRKAIGLPQTKGMKRKELKALSVRYVYENYGVSGTDDEADAICIGAAHLIKEQSEENKENTENE